MAAILPRVYPQMLEEVHAHQDAGRATFIVSAAGDGVVEPLAHVLGMDGGIGTRYEVDGEGAFTGRFDGPFVYGAGKVEAMEAFAAGHDIDLAAVLRLLRLALRPADAARPSATRSSSIPTRPWPRSPSARAGRRCASSASAAGSRSRAAAPARRRRSGGAVHATPRARA